MYYFYNNTDLERRNAWRNAYEVKLAARRHEERRFQSIEDASLAKPQVIKKKRLLVGSGLSAVSLLLLSLLAR